MDAETGALRIPSQGSRHTRDFIVDSIAGAAGGVACVYAGQPLDTVKVKMQAFPDSYKGGFDCFKQVIRADGIHGLYKGSVPALACNVAENAVLFMALGFSKKIVGTLSNRDHNDLSSFHNACAGALAGSISALAINPAELVKCRVQAMSDLAAAGKVSSKSVGPVAVVKKVIRDRGPMGFMTGITSTWAREIPGNFFVFYGYDVAKSLVTPEGKSKDDIGPLGLIFAGGTAGTCFWLSVYPLDAVKSRIQVLSLTGERFGFFTTFMKIVRTEGFLKLYSGLVPCILRSYPANGALFLAYEVTQKLLGDF